MRSDIPFYANNKGGGAITLGSHPIGATITFTQNWFDDNANHYEDHGYGLNTLDWLDQLSHEVRHMPQIGKAGGYLAYASTALGQYAAYGSHDKAPNEIEADLGSKIFRDFKAFVSKNYGGNALSGLFEAVSRHAYIRPTIDKWWSEYQEDHRKKTKNF